LVWYEIELWDKTVIKCDEASFDSIGFELIDDLLKRIPEPLRDKIREKGRYIIPLGIRVVILSDIIDFIPESRKRKVGD